MARSVDVVRVLLVSPENKVAVCQRIETSYEGGKWCLFGGKADSEDLPAEAIREVYEGSGLMLKGIAFFLSMVAREIDGDKWRQHYFWSRISNDEQSSIEAGFNRKEIESVDFVDQYSLLEKPFAFNDDVVVVRFLQSILQKI